MLGLERLVGSVGPKGLGLREKIRVFEIGLGLERLAGSAET